MKDKIRKSKKKEHKKASLSAYKGPKTPPALKEFFNDLTQKEAKPFCPPKGSVWRANKRQNWSFHQKPHKRHSVPWSEFGGNSFESLLHGLRKSWLLYLEDEGLEPEDCPILGLLATGS